MKERPATVSELSDSVRLGRSAMLACLLAAAACSAPTVESVDAGADPADLFDTCNSASAAAASKEASATSGATNCFLVLGEPRTAYLAPLDDKDWYAIDVPPLASSQQLLTVRAHYSAQTPVTLSLNVLASDGKTSLGSAVDSRPRGAPGEVAVVVRLAEAGRYYVLAQHASAEDPAADRRNSYSIVASVANDQDLNEPNDVTPTPVTLAACDATVQAKGALSTAGDLDRFAFDVSPCNSSRTILHLTLQAPNPSGRAIQLEYTLLAPDGQVAARASSNTFGAQSLLTAQLVQAGRYQLVVQSHASAHQSGPAPGDPDFDYTLTLARFADLDPSEGPNGNDTLATARAVTPSATPVSGRLSYAGDLDLYAITVTLKTRIHYKLFWATTGNRAAFTRLPTLQLRELALYSEMPASTCTAGAPNGCPGSRTAEGAGWCAAGKCLRQRRLESTAIPNQANFEGQVFLPPGTKPYLVQVAYQGGEGADDLPYSLVIEEVSPVPWDDPHDTFATAKVVAASASGAMATGSTTLGHGFGARASGVIPNGLTLLPRNIIDDWEVDYDAESDTDLFEFSFTPLTGPVADAGTGVLDHALRVAWSVPPATGQAAGQRSYDMGLRFHFCTDAACTPSKRIASNGYLGYRSGLVEVWYRPGSATEPDPVGFDFNQAAGTFTARDAQCLCLGAKYAAGGKLFVEVKAHNRTSYADARMNLSVGVFPYPLEPACASKPCAWVESITQ